MTQSQDREAIYCTSLHEANSLRDKQWNANGIITLSFRAAELFGEGGEAANNMKKMERERLGLVGTRCSKSDLEEELADVVICTSLLAMQTDIDLDKEMAFVKHPDEIFEDYSMAATQLGQRIGSVCGHIEHNWKAHAKGNENQPTARRLLVNHLVRVMITINLINKSFDLDVTAKVIEKFNTTSRKHGFIVFLKETT